MKQGRVKKSTILHFHLNQNMSMTTTLRKYLQRQTLFLVVITFSIGLVVLGIASILQTIASQKSSLESLASTVNGQIDALLPSFLLPEVAEGRALLLHRFKTEEGLNSVAILPTGQNPARLFSACEPKNGMVLCRDILSGQIAVSVPISHEHHEYGHLLKTKNVSTGIFSKSFISTALTLSVAMLVSLLGLVGIVMRFTSTEIPAATGMLLEELRRCLAGEAAGPAPNFRFSEFQNLAIAIDKLINAAQEGRRNAAIAQTTQMLAHDIRKPFSMLKILIELLSDVKNMDEHKDALNSVIPEIDRAVLEVNGLLQDIMELGTRGELRKCRLLRSLVPQTALFLTLS
jgi:signal transduction histidine kinase